MDYSKGQGSNSSQALPGRRSREERRSLSETLADGTSKFFSSMVAKKNGLFSDISNKIENTFAPKTDTISNSTGSDGSGSPPPTPPVPNTPPPRPPPPKRLPSMGSSQEKMNVMKRMSSMPAYSRTDSRTDNEFAPQMARESKDDSSKYSIGGMNVSFDQPIYNQKRDLNQKHQVDNKTRTAGFNQDNRPSHPATMSRSDDQEGAQRINRNAVTTSNTQNARAPSYAMSRSTPPSENTIPSDQSTSPTSKSQPTPAPRRAKSPGTTVSNNQPSSPDVSNSRDEGPVENTTDEKQLRRDQNKSSSSEEWSDKQQTSDDSNKSYHNDRSPDSSGSSVGKTQGHKKTPKLTTARRSSTVDEMLFDDYVDPEVDTVIQKVETPPENLISFEPEVEITRSDSSGTEGNTRELATGRSVDSSDVEYGGTVVPRSTSMGSDKSWSSSYSVDSQPDDLTLECMEFMKSFVDKVFQNGEEISQTDKAKFGELCQHFPGRLWFARYVNAQRVHNKCVSESIFFRLMQYFAVCLFECNEVEDYSPAKTLMTMCFTFFHEAQSPCGGGPQITNGGGAPNEKVFLYTYMREQPIWQSLRFWNAAFFDAVQCERSRRPMPTNSAENQTVNDDKKFQENITFGQLGTFACNMRSFGLSKELCLEFLRKQSTIANLRSEQVKLLRDNIERAREN